ncbi:MAG: hypothetical protein IT371_17370 [Deltaproteobacteria bacterium]|nr:hypothetical protein [Deltaproteobacteria bacterium]
MRFVLPLVGLTAACASSALAQVRYDKTVELPVAGAEEVRIVNRLGSVVVSGWDRAEVRVTATKQAPDAELGERLRVEVSSRNGAQIDVQTYIRLQPPLSPDVRALLEDLMQRQANAAQRLLGSERDREAARKEMRRIQLELAELGRRMATAPRPAQQDLSVPVTEGRVDLELRVPRQLRVTARTFRHGIALTGCRGGADLSSEEGELRVEDTRGDVATRSQHGRQALLRVAGRVDLRGGAGDVTLRELTGPVHAVVFSGRIDARRLGARTANLKTVRGEVRVDGDVPAGGGYVVLSRDGRVTAYLPRKPSLRLETHAPAVVASDPRLRERLRRAPPQALRLGGGRGELSLQSLRGVVRLVLETDPTEE